MKIAIDKIYIFKTWYMYQNGAKTIGDFLSADRSFMLKTDFSNKNQPSRGMHNAELSPPTTTFCFLNYN